MSRYRTVGRWLSAQAGQLGRMACHRMTWMRAPTFAFLHDLSAVYTGAFKASPSAKQARSPNDNPSGRVCATRSPTTLACSEVKETASRMGLSPASHASSGLSPFPQVCRALRPIDAEHPEDAKGRCKFPFGDFKRVHCCAVLSAESRAGQYKHIDIERAAAHLPQMIDGKKHKARATSA